MIVWVIALTVLALTAFAAALALRGARSTFEQLVDLDTPLAGDLPVSTSSPRRHDTRTAA